jgi:hypothetical protein
MAGRSVLAGRLSATAALAAALGVGALGAAGVAYHLGASGQARRTEVAEHAVEAAAGRQAASLGTILLAPSSGPGGEDGTTARQGSGEASLRLPTGLPGFLDVPSGTVGAGPASTNTAVKEAGAVLSRALSQAEQVLSQAFPQEKQEVSRAAKEAEQALSQAEQVLSHSSLQGSASSSSG